MSLDRGAHRLGILCLVFVAGGANLASARPSRGVVHRVKTEAETYERIAEHYYGLRFLGHHLRVLNRHPEPLSVGRSLVIPTCRKARLGKGQSVEDFAKTHLSKVSRAPYLKALHFLKSKRPSEGKALKVPTSLRHVVRPGESLASVARRYYRDASRRRLRLLRLYNELPSATIKVGYVLRIPLDTPAFDHVTVVRRSRRPFGTLEKSAEPVAAKVPSAPIRVARTAVVPPRQARREVDAAERLFADGRYDDCLKLGRRVLKKHASQLALAPQVELLRLTGSSLVALGRVPDATTMFSRLKKLDPSYELDLYRTSPKVLGVFRAAK